MTQLTRSLFVSSALLLVAGCGTTNTDSIDLPTNNDTAATDPAGLDVEAPIADASEKPISEQSKGKTMATELATFGGGCFWCTEAVFQRIDGVEKVVSGYCNGDIDNPTYEQVCTGKTGHAEVIQITFDPSKVKFARLLEVHFKTHDPTTLNRQGADTGTQYRSGIYCHNEDQKQQAESVKKQLDDSGAFIDPIVTEVVMLEKFYPAEDYHQNYYNLNGKTNPYCTNVIVPKVEKFKKVFADILKSE